MRLLLDTQVWLWLNAAPERLAARARRAATAERNELFLSAASAWEISIKHALGKLSLPVPPREYVPSRMRRGGVLPLAITLAHALRVGELPLHHRDPFDRLLVAQAQTEDLVLLTADERLVAYEVEILTA